MNRIRLFCFPYAGGSSEIFLRWKKYLDQNIELNPIELSGRGHRCNELFYDDFESVIEDVYKIIKYSLSDVPYAFLGHSMGSLIAYELCYKLIEFGDEPPIHIFFRKKCTQYQKGRKDGLFIIGYRIAKKVKRTWRYPGGSIQ